MQTQRITDSMLIKKVDLINTMFPRQLSIGHYYLTHQYGGVALYQVEQNGDRNVFNMGHVPKRMLYELMDAYINGIQEARKNF